MEFLSHFLAILVPLALVTTYIFRAKMINQKNSTTKTPEPPGALPIIGHLHLLRGQEPLARTLGSMADKLGPIFSLQLGHHHGLVVSSWEMVKQCLGTNDKIFATRPGMAVGEYLGYKYASFALAPYGPYWRDVRKVVTLELLTSHRLQKLERVRISEINHCMKEIYLLCSKNNSFTNKLKINSWFDDLTFNLTIRMLVGKRFDYNSSAEDLHIKEDIKRALYLGGVFVVSDFIPILEWMDIGGHVKSLKQTFKELDQVFGRWLEEHVEKRKACGANGEGDFMDVMLSILAEDSTMFGHGRDTIIKATILILIMTGSESTAETLTWALSLLLNNPHALRIARDELDSKIGSHRWVEESDLKNLTYLQAIIKETLRLYPPGPLAGPHEATEDCHIGGYYVPKGTRLIVNIWKLHRDQRVWLEHDKFRPERFLEEHKGVTYQGQNFEYIPFSSGRRMCPAVTYGSQVVQLILARLLQGFDISTPTGQPVDMSEGLGIALPKVKPVEIIVTPRLPRELYHNL